jgi:hypothetical protein
VEAEERAFVGGATWRRGDAVGLELAQALITDPVRGPWRIQYGVHGDVSDSDKFLKRFANVALNTFCCWTACVGGAQVNVAYAVFKSNGPYDAEVHDRKGRNLRVCDVVQAELEVRNAYHVASG